MTAKEFLEQYQEADQRINTELDEITRLWSIACKTTSAPSGSRVQTGAEDKTEKIVEKIMDAEDDVNQDIDQLIDLRRHIRHVIAAVPNAAERAVLRERYISGKRWEEIAVDLHYTYRHVTRLHGTALLAIKDVLKCPRLS